MIRKQKRSLSELDIIYRLAELEYNFREIFQFYYVIHFSVGKSEKTGLLNVMLSMALGFKRRKLFTLTFQPLTSEHFFREYGRLQF